MPLLLLFLPTLLLLLLQSRESSVGVKCVVWALFFVY